MNIVLTQLIQEQIRGLMTMMSAGVVVVTFWEIKKIIVAHIKSGIRRLLPEIVYWFMVWWILSEFMYYGTRGEINICGAFGFLTGLLLWKKICCVIIASWVKDEAENSETTAKSLIWIRREKNDRRNGKPRRSRN